MQNPVSDSFISFLAWFTSTLFTFIPKLLGNCVCIVGMNLSAADKPRKADAIGTNCGICINTSVAEILRCNVTAGSAIYPVYTEFYTGATVLSRILTDWGTQRGISWQSAWFWAGSEGLSGRAALSLVNYPLLKGRMSNAGHRLTIPTIPPTEPAGEAFDSEGPRKTRNVPASPFLAWERWMSSASRVLAQ